MLNISNPLPQLASCIFSNSKQGASVPFTISGSSFNIIYLFVASLFNDVSNLYYSFLSFRWQL